MNSVKLLDCTLRDGGYVNDWNFSQADIKLIVNNLTDAGVDYIELGYITSVYMDVNGSRFQNIEAASRYIPEQRKITKYNVMADVAQFDTDALCDRSESTPDAIRVVFYKRQIEQAFSFCKKVTEKGYDLILQPMVTIDYTKAEFSDLVKRFSNEYKLYAISVVDSFGCMKPNDVVDYVTILSDYTDDDVRLGFHGHNNMQMSNLNATALLKLDIGRDLILDASVNGIGRGAGNLPLEFIATYMNSTQGSTYQLDKILNVMSEVTEPLSKTSKWGYSPYFFLTAYYHAHPNFASYLLSEHDVNLSEFHSVLKLIPQDMLTRCTRPYVRELYKQFKGDRDAEHATNHHRC